MKKFFCKLQSGQSLVEIVLVIGLSAIILPALLTGLVSSRQGKAQQAQRTQAVYLLNETVDAVRSVREKGWASFATNGTFHPTNLGTSWALVTGSVVVNGLTQSVTIGDVNRDTNGAIVVSGGSLDPSSKKVNVDISWGQPYLSTVSATLYMTRYLNNNSFIQTTVADFNAGTKSGTMITNTAGGEVTLASTGKGDWCKPADRPIKELNLPKSGVANALTAIEGRAFVGTGDNAAGAAFVNITIGNNPPNPFIAGTYDPPPPPIKTNSVFGETNYAYLSTDNNSKEVIIISLTQYSDPPTNSKYLEVGSINLPGNINANNIYVTNNTAYILGSDKKLYVYDITTRAKNYGISDYSGIIGLSGNGKKVTVTGGYAYVATDATSNNFQIINIKDSTNLTISEQLTLGVGQAGVDVYVDTSSLTPSRAYFVTVVSSGKPDFFVIDISNPLISPSKIGVGYDTYTIKGMSPKGVTVVSSNNKPIAAIIVGTGGEEYQVINIQNIQGQNNESNPSWCGGLNVDTGINGVSSVLESDGDAYSYIVTGDVSTEFKIIEGGPGGSFGTSGDFTSSAFDAGYSTAFNRFDVSINRPSSTDVKFQVAVSSAVSGSCSDATFNFVGPDSSSSTFFTTSVTSGTQGFSFVVPPSINPGKCFKYKAFLSTTDPLSAPIFYDMTGNYSP